MGSDCPVLPQCAYCQHRKCDPYPNPAPEDARCMLGPLVGDDREDVVGFYREGIGEQVMKAADTVLSHAHADHTSHLDALIEFCYAMDFQRIGIATCTMFLKESRVLAKAFKDAGFVVTSIACKTGEVTRPEVGLEGGKSSSCVCNPYRQAQLLNDAQTDLNINVGLCVGHDMIFNKVSDALVTTFFCKDYATDHKAIEDLR